MITQRTITFTTTPSNNRSAAGDIRYQSHLVHNRVLNVEDTRNGFDRRYPLLAGMSGFINLLKSSRTPPTREQAQAALAPPNRYACLEGMVEPHRSQVKAIIDSDNPSRECSFKNPLARRDENMIYYHSFSAMGK